MKTLTLNAARLGLDPGSCDETDVFCWLIASFLSGKRIQQGVALSAYHVIVVVHGVDSVQRMAACSHRQLVSMLGEGRYARYDESTASRLTALCQQLIEHYDGKASELVRRSTDAKDLAKRLQAFAGIGPKTAEIFMRAVGPPSVPSV
jgi:endonuclease III